MIQKQTDFALAQAGDQDAMEALLRRHDALAFRIAQRFAHPFSSRFDDLKQAGVIGLWKAITQFDPTRGFAFSTYAWKCVLNSVSAENLRLGYSVIHVPQDYARDSEERRRLKKRARHEVISLSAPLSNGGVLEDILVGSTVTPAQEYEERDEQRLSMDRFRRRLIGLPRRQRQVVAAHINGMRAKDIAAEMGVTKQRVSQLWDEATRRLRTDHELWAHMTRICEYSRATGASVADLYHLIFGQDP